MAAVLVGRLVLAAGQESPGSVENRLDCDRETGLGSTAGTVGSRRGGRDRGDDAGWLGSETAAPLCPICPKRHQNPCFCLLPYGSS